MIPELLIAFGVIPAAAAGLSVIHSSAMHSRSLSERTDCSQMQAGMLLEAMMVPEVSSAAAGSTDK